MVTTIQSQSLYHSLHHPVCAWPGGARSLRERSVGLPNLARPRPRLSCVCCRPGSGRLVSSCPDRRGPWPLVTCHDRTAARPPRRTSSCPDTGELSLKDGQTSCSLPRQAPHTAMTHRRSQCAEGPRGADPRPRLSRLHAACRAYRRRAYQGWSNRESRESRGAKFAESRRIGQPWRLSRQAAQRLHAAGRDSLGAGLRHSARLVCDLEQRGPSAR
jgi:hypothetical protein